MERSRQSPRSKSGEYVAIYRFMTEGLGLRGSCLLVYSRIFSFCKFEGGSFYESKRSTGRFLGLSDRQVQRALKSLRELGLIQDAGEWVLESGKITRRYELNEDAARSAMSRIDEAHARRKGMG